MASNFTTFSVKMRGEVDEKIELLEISPSDVKMELSSTK